MIQIPFKHKILISKHDIQTRVQELGAQITKDFRGADPLVVIVVLKGASIFAGDLLRALELPVQVEFIGVSSYSGTQSTGHVRITNDLSEEIKGKNVLLVEDIIDSGITLDYLVRTLKIRDPKSLHICTFLSKPHAHVIKQHVDYVGFEISNEFVIGYGLDLDGLYRNCPDLIQKLD